MVSLFSVSMLSIKGDGSSSSVQNNQQQQIVNDLTADTQFTNNTYTIIDGKVYVQQDATQNNNQQTQEQPTNPSLTALNITNTPKLSFGADNKLELIFAKYNQTALTNSQEVKPIVQSKLLATYTNNQIIIQILEPYQTVEITASNNAQMVFGDLALKSDTVVTLTENQFIIGKAITNNNGTTLTAVSSSVSRCYSISKGTINIKNASYKPATGYTGRAIYLTGGQLNLTNCSFDGFTSEHGGALCVESTSANTVLNINGSTFTNCKSTTSSGGAILVGSETATTTISNNSTFTNNTSKLHGGAIWARGVINISDSTFTGNTADITDGAGGAVCLYETATITNSTFKQNSANYGGGLYTSGAGGSTTITGCTIESNTSVTNGAGIITCNDTTINGNTVIKQNIASGSHGGGIFLHYGKTNISSTTFIENSTGHYGGAIFVRDSAELTVESTATFTGNTATYGGAISGYGSTSAIIIKGGNFASNNATYGGVIYSGTVLNVQGGTFTSNNAENGGVIMQDASTLTITGGTFTGNSATGCGGVVYANVQAVVHFSAGTMGNGSATTAATSTSYSNSAVNGGAIYICGGSTLNISGSAVIAHNKATDGGAVLLSSDSSSNTVNIDGVNVYIKHNYASNRGGGVWGAGGTTTLKAGTITGNSANFGAGIFAVSALTISGGTLSNNTATSDGGGIWAGSTTTITAGTISGNSANYGGGIYNYENATLTFTGATVSGNSAKTYGGGFVNHKTLTINGGEIVNNSAASGGGGIINFKTLNITGGEMHHNSTSNYGGAIYTVNEGSVATIRDCEIYSNTADSIGGAIVVSNKGVLNIPTGVSIHSNTASHGGGVGVIDAATFNFSGGEINSNTATAYGGAIYTSNMTDTGNSAITANTFISGTAQMSSNTAPTGGAIHSGWNYYHVNVFLGYSDATTKAEWTGSISYNSAIYGGAINNNGFLFIDSGNITNNTCYNNADGYSYGGAIHTYTYLTISGGNIANNGGGDTPTYQGGAIYQTVHQSSTQYYTTITGGTFTGNTSIMHGGAIHADDGSLNISGGTFTSNTSRHGGAVHIHSVTAQITGGTFTQNTATYGGAYFNGTYSTTTISGNANFTKNNADPYGGAIYSNGTLNINGGTFTENVADASDLSSDEGHGGALFLSVDSTTTITAGTFTGNIAAYSGHAIYTGGTTTISGGTFTTTGQPNALIYCYNTNVTVSGGSFTADVYTLDMAANTASDKGYTLAGNPTLNGGYCDIWLGTNAFVKVDTALTTDYTVIKHNLTCIDENEDYSSYIAYSTNSDYLTSAYNHLKVTNLPSNMQIDNGIEVPNYLVIEYKDATITFDNNKQIANGGSLTLESDLTGWGDWGDSGFTHTTKDGNNCAMVTGALNTTRCLYQTLGRDVIASNLGKAISYTVSAKVRLDNFVAGSTNPYLALYIDGTKYDGTWMGPSYSPSADLSQFNNQGWVTTHFTATFSASELAEMPLGGPVFFIYARDFTGTLYIYDYTVSIKTVGEQDYDATSYQLRPTQNMQLPANPTMAGYTFKGWFTAPVGGTQITTSSTVPTVSTRYYAQWEANEITVNISTLSGTTNDATVMGTSNATYTTKQHIGTQINLTYTLNTTNNFTFEKWVNGTSWDGTTISNTYTISADDATAGTVNIKACFVTTSLTYAVTNYGVQDATGGTVTVLPQATPGAYSANNWAYLGTSHGDYREHTASAKSGYVFKGWYIDSACTSLYSTDATISYSATKGEYVFYALFLENVTISINANGGSYNGEASGSFTTEYGQVLQLDIPTKQGYTFNGWTISSNSGASLNSNGVFGTPLKTSPAFENGSNGLYIYNNSANGNVVHTIKTHSGNVPNLSGYYLNIQTTGAVTPGFGGFYFNTYSYANAVFYSVFIAKIPKGFNLAFASNSAGGVYEGEWITINHGTGEWETYAYKMVCGNNGSYSTTNFFYLTTSSSYNYPISWDVAYAQVFDATGKTATTANTSKYVIAGTGTTTLTANWIVNPYILTLNAGTGVKSAVTSGSYSYGTSVTATATLNTGYKFVGWYNGDTLVSNNASYTFTMPAHDLSLTAVGTPITYTIAYDGNGNTGGSTASSTHTYDTSKNLTVNGFTKTGYTFTGWAKTATGTVAYSDGHSVINLSNTETIITLYAVWKVNTYYVKYNGNGNTSGSMSNSTHTYGTAKQLTANAFIKIGYTFTGWNSATSGTGTAYTDKQSVLNLSTTNGDTVNIYAQWQINTYTLSLNNGYYFSTSGYTVSLTAPDCTITNSTLSSTNPTSKVSHTYSTTPINVTITCNDAQLWIYIDGTSVTSTANSATYSWTPSADHTFTWYLREYYDVEAKTSEGVVSSQFSWVLWTGTTHDTVEKYTSTTVMHGSSIQFYTTIANGYTFDGWYNGSTKVSSDTTFLYTDSLTGDVTLTAKTSANTYTIYIDENGAGAVDDQTYTVSTASQNKTLARPTAPNGYSFASWSITTNSSSTGSSVVSSTNILTIPAGDYGNITVKANWSPNKIHITLDKDGGSGGTDEFWYIYNTATYYSDSDCSTQITVLDLPSKAGYIFVHYYGDGTCGGSANERYAGYSDVSYGFAGDLHCDIYKNATLYASWTPIKYTVTYDDNGGSGATANSSHTYDVSAALTTNGFENVGYVFSGWAKTSTGSAVYSDGESVKNLTTTNNGTVTLYAVWSPITYYIRYNGNGNTGGSTATSTHVYNVSSNTTANGFTKTGYTFSGWSLTDSGSVQYNNGDSVLNLSFTNNAIIDFYAVWSAITYTVSYNGNGYDGGSTSNSTHTYDTAKNLTANGYTKTGYTFTGWNSSSDGTGTAYTNQQSVKNLSSTANDTVTIYAQWQINTYTLSFSNGYYYSSSGYTVSITAPDCGVTNETLSSTNSTSKVSHTYSTTAITITIACDDAQLWIYIDDNYHTSGDNSITYSWIPNADHTFTWYIREYSDVEATAGTGISSAQFTAVRTDMNQSHSNATKQTSKSIQQGLSIQFYASVSNGYTFDGWYNGDSNVSSDLTYLYTDDLAGDVSLTAKATPNTYGVYINEVNAANLLSTYTVSVSNQQITLTRPTAPNGYSFSSWSITTNSSSTGSSIDSSTNVLSIPASDYGNIVVEVNWSANLVEIELFLSDCGKIYYIYDTDKYYSDQTCKTQITSVSIPSKTGYLFNGFFTDIQGEGSQYLNSSGTIINDLYKSIYTDTTLYAYWTPITYTVAYNANGGGNTTQSSSHTYDEAKNLTANGFSRTGYTFTGWNTASNGTGTGYANQESVTNLTATNGATVTLYALWEPITYTIKFAGGGGSGSMSSVSVSYDTEYQLPVNTFTKSNYSFAGWYANVDAGLYGATSSTITNSVSTTSLIKDEYYVINLSSTADATVTLTAQWNINTYDVSDTTVYLNGQQNSTLNNGVYITVGTTQYTVNQILSGIGGIAHGTSIKISSSLSSSYKITKIIVDGSTTYSSTKTFGLTKSSAIQIYIGSTVTVTANLDAEAGSASYLKLLPEDGWSVSTTGRIATRSFYYGEQIYYHLPKTAIQVYDDYSNVGKVPNTTWESVETGSTVGSTAEAGVVKNIVPGSINSISFIEPLTISVYNGSTWYEAMFCAEHADVTAMYIAPGNSNYSSLSTTVTIDGISSLIGSDTESHMLYSGTPVTFMEDGFTLVWLPYVGLAIYNISLYMASYVYNNLGYPNIVITTVGSAAECFVADTQVTTLQETSLNASFINFDSNGFAILNGTKYFMQDNIVYKVTYANIQDIAVGDLVLGFSDKSNKNIVTTVKQTIYKPEVITLAKIKFSDGTTLEMSQYHPLYTTDGWKSLNNYHGYDTLQVGHIVYTQAGTKVITEIQQWIASQSVEMFNLGLQDLNGNYAGYYGFYADDVLAQAHIYTPEEVQELENNTGK